MQCFYVVLFIVQKLLCDSGIYSSAGQEPVLISLTSVWSIQYKRFTVLSFVLCLLFTSFKNEILSSLFYSCFFFYFWH